MIDDKMVEWHHQFIEHESEQTLGEGEGQGTWRVAVHGVGDAVQPFHPLSSPSPSAFNLSHHQGLFQ